MMRLALSWVQRALSSQSFCSVSSQALSPLHEDASPRHLPQHVGCSREIAFLPTAPLTTNHRASAVAKRLALEPAMNNPGR